LLTVCPACGAATFVKQVTAAGFQLKGSGWYVTDFRGGDTSQPKPVDAVAKSDTAKSESTTSPDTPATAAKSDAAPAPATAPAPAAPAAPPGSK
jgi:predicted nucleic acid-binding Zn ribbon protein